MKPILKAIDEQAVVLFGATSGIGLETALQMVEKGAQVAIVGRSQEGLNEALEQLRIHAEASRMARGHHNGSSNLQANSMANMEAGGTPITDMEEQVIGIEADITNFEQVKAVAEQVVQRFGRIDTWVNVAAVSEYALFEDTSPDEFRRIIEVNLVGHAYGAMVALPYMRQSNGGSLIFVSSMAGRIPIPYQSAYNASKHGILGLAETLRQELKHTHVPVSVTAIIPSSINTPLFDKARTKLGVEPNPIPPVYDAQMVAKAIVYAAQHPVRELIVGDAGYAMTFMRRLAPTLTSNYMSAAGFRMQRSNEPKSAQAPDNLYHHMTGYDQVSGEMTRTPMSRSGLLTWLSTHPRARMAIVAGVVGTITGLLGWQIVKARNERRNSLSYQIPHRTKKLVKQARKVSKQAGKFSLKAGKTLREAGMAARELPVISALPMFQRKSRMDQVTDTLSGGWAAVQGFVLALPFLQRKSMLDRITSRGYRLTSQVPFIERRPSLAQRLTLAEQRKAAADFTAKQRKTAAEFVTDRSKTAAGYVTDRSKTAAGYVTDRAKTATDFVSEQRKSVVERVSKTSKASGEKVADAIPTRKEIRKGFKRAAALMPEREPVTIRRRIFIDKRPTGEYRETVIEKRSKKA